MSQVNGRFAALGLQRVWHHVDLSKETRTLGVVASQIALALIGKHKPIVHETEDAGDYVVVTNATHLKVTGRKLSQKTYWSHTFRPGSGEATPMDKIIRDLGHKEVIKRAVSRMLPKNRYRKVRLDRLKVFDGSENPYNGNVIAWADEQGSIEQLKLESEERKHKLLQFEKLLKEKDLVL
ncbi:mitochondrial 54S ribosomal protein YmL23 [Martiniozyma asiatica (nom. inval.)]|nr:mitochondrial 54S ribosomal protein YmL23 [Martiniozyma asiatica]